MCVCRFSKTKRNELQTDGVVWHSQKNSATLISATQIRPRFRVRKRHPFVNISDRYVECRCAACALRLSCDNRGWRKHPGHEHTRWTSCWAWVPTWEARLLRQKADSPDETSWPCLRVADLLGPPDLSICEKQCRVSKRQDHGGCARSGNGIAGALSFRNSWSEKRPRFGYRFRTQNGYAFRPP